MPLIGWTSLLIAAYAPFEAVQWSCIEGTGQGRVDVVVGAGALHESDDARGVAHLLEHLIFRESNFSYRHQNGKTTLDFTHYYRTTRRTDLSTAAVSLLSELAKPTFTAEDVAIERKVVIKELEERGLDRSRGPDPLFGPTPLARSPGGTAADVRALTTDDVMSFHRKFYGRRNVGVRVVNAVDCAALKNRLQPLFSEWAEGATATTPVIAEKEPGSVTLPTPKFEQGYYWYTGTPQEQLLWVAVGEHLRLTALRELRQEQGLVYSPELVFQRLGPGGLVLLKIDAGENGRAVARWFDNTIAAIKTEPRVTAHMAEALDRVGQWLDERPEYAALAAVRGEPEPRRLLDRLRRSVPQRTLDTMLQERRRFGSQLPQSNILSLIVLGGFGALVLAALYYAGRQFMS